MWNKHYLTMCTFKPTVNQYKKADSNNNKKKEENIFERLTAPKEEPKPFKNVNLTFKPNLCRLKKR